MKKRLALLLSVAMAFSMFANVAFGADADKTTQEKFDALKTQGVFNGYPDGSAGLEKEMTRAEFAKVLVKLFGFKEIHGTYSYKDKNYGPKNWAAPFIEAVTHEGLMQGKDLVKKIFDFNGKITIEEASKTLVTALKLEPVKGAQNNASAWAKEYFQAAIDAGLFSKDVNPKANATRAQLVEAAFAADEMTKGPKVVSYKVIDSKTVEFTMSDKEVQKVTLDKALEPNKETEVTFTYKNKEGKEFKITTKVTYTVTDATKVESITANNLREVKVKFDGEVDPMTGADESNYSLNNDAKVKSVVLSADKREATLTVYQGSNENEGLKNQKEYKLTVSNVRAGSKVITAKDVKFTPVDSAIPTVEKVDALGTKAIKLTFSEPIKKASNSNLKIDGQIVGGSTDITSNTVIFKLHNALTVGEHTVKVESAEDFAGFKSIASEHKFTVVEDTTAPTIANVEKATFEKVTLKFSEPVDKATVIAGNVYWMQGSTKKYANKVNAISDDTYEFEFSTANRMLYTTDLYVSEVKDYSGNVIAKDSKIQVNPVVDQTRPEVINAELKDDLTTIEVKFSKTLDLESAQKQANYVIKDKDGKEVQKIKKDLKVDGKKVTIVLFEKLSENKDYTLEINGVTDNTTLKNVMMPYSAKLEVGNKSRPSVSDVTYIKDENKIIVTFSKEMATSGEGSIVSTKNYLYAKKDDVKKELPEGTEISVSSDGKAAIIYIDSSEVKVEDITTFYVQMVRDTAGNVLDEVIVDKKPQEAQAIQVEKAAATSKDKIEVTFNQSLQSGSASVNDFTVKAGTANLSVSNAEVDGKKVTLTLSDSDKLKANAQYDGKDVTVSVRAKGSLITPSGKRVEVVQEKAVADEIKPEVDKLDTNTVTSSTYSVNVVFTEDLDVNVDKALAVYDFDIKADGDTLTPRAQFEITKISGNRITVELKKEVYNKYIGKLVEIRVKPLPSHIKDLKGNVAKGSENFEGAYIEK